MGTLMKLMKAMIGAALLNKAVRGAGSLALIGLVNWISRPSTGRRIGSLFSDLLRAPRSGMKPGYNPGFIQSLLKGLLAFALLRSTKRGFAQPAMLSALAALLLSLMKTRERHHERHEPGDRIIDVEDYTIVD